MIEPVLQPSKPFYQKLALVLISLVALVFVAVIGKQILCPLVFGFLFAILLLPMARSIERRWHLKRIAAAGLTVLAMMLAIIGLLFLVSTQLIKVSQDMPQLNEQVSQLSDKTKVWVKKRFDIDMAEQEKFLEKTTKDFKKSTPSLLGSTVLSVSSILIFWIFIFLDTFFLIAYRKMLMQFILDVFLEHNNVRVLDIISRIQFIIRNYIVGLFLEMLIVAGICMLAFVFLGIKYALLLALITALFNIIPYIGIFCALIINLVIVFATTAILSKVILVGVVVIIVHLIDSNILLPVIVGSKVRINAFITILGVVLGEMIWGLSGMFLSIPIIAIAKIIFDKVEHLNPWGHLLGYETFEKKPLKFNYQFRRHKENMMNRS